jgi:thioredoxin reductase (NADPH)
MANPVRPIIWVVDDDPNVLSAVKRDLAARYGRDYRIMDATSGPVALDALKRLEQREEPVALFLVDQRMPQMTGVEFLGAARALYPQARRALLTAYADTEAAIQAINGVKVDHYLLKPWNPPDEHLYPVLDELLYGWRAEYRPCVGGVRVLGHRWSPEAHAIKDFLGRNRVPYRWLDIESNPEACALMDRLQLESVHLPVVVYEDGTHVINPTPIDIATKVGLRVELAEEPYDLAIVGGGPAGLAAAVYGASEGLRTVLLEKEAPGGQAGTSSRIENYLGFPAGISGGELMGRAVDQAKKFGAGIEDSYRILHLSDGREINSRAVILATGLRWRKLDAPGIERLTGAGVYYGASRAETRLCEGEDVYIVGGANSAGQAALDAAQYARCVTMLVRGTALSSTMSHYLIEQINKTSNIRLRTCCTVAAAEGEDHLRALRLRNATTGEEEVVEAASLFIFIGAEPCTEWLEGVVARDEHGYLLAGTDLMTNGKRPQGWPLDRDPTFLETSVPGVYAVGDVRHNSVKRCASGVGTGSAAVQFVHQYLATIR